MTRHKEQRLAVFVDVQNMYYSARQLYSSKVNFRAILQEAVAGRRLVRAFAYVIKADVKEEVNFFDALTNIGFEVKAKDLQIFYGGAKKGDWDVGLAMDMIRMVPKIDTAVLVSGDGDFKELIEYLKSMGTRVEVLSFGPTTSQKLLDVTDLFTDMGKEKKKFLIASRPRFRRGSKEPAKVAEAKEPKADTPQEGNDFGLG